MSMPVRRERSRERDTGIFEGSKMEDGMKFKRSVEIEYDVSNDENIIVSSYLHDEVAGSVMHDIEVNMVIARHTLNIMSINGKINKPDYLNCQDALKGIEGLVGLSLKRGFNKQMLSAIGGIKGCFQLNNLLLQVGNSAFVAEVFRAEEQIMQWKRWVERCERQPDKVKENIEFRLNQVPELGNSCFVCKVE